MIAAGGPATVIRRAGVVQQEFPGAGGGQYINSSGPKGSKGFSALEQVWIDEVLSDPALSLVLKSFPNAKPAVLHRVEDLGTAVGEYSNDHNAIAIQDSVYEKPEPEFEADFEEEDFAEEHENRFKTTLIHEIFHYVAATGTADGRKIILPANVVQALVHPKKANLPPYAFGWFVHPATGRVAHFSENLMDPNDPESIENYPDLRKARSDGQWEGAPYRGGRDLSSPEEDAAESFATAMVSPESSEEFKSRFPQRHALLDRWLGHLNALREADGAKKLGE